MDRKHFVSTFGVFAVLCSLALVSQNVGNVVLLAAANEGSEQSDFVRELTDENFESLTQASSGMTTGDWFIKFYAPWCLHCTNLLPVWSSLSKELKGIINVAKVDITKNSKIGRRFAVETFPTLLYLRKQHFYEYTVNNRTLESLKSFALSKYNSVDLSDAIPIPHPPNILDDIKQACYQIYYDSSKVFNYSPFVLPFYFFLGVLSTLIICFLGSFFCFRKTQVHPSTASKKIQNKKIE